jgi:acyl-CoA synthetase (AMP-forming)/AMP-acid ligase II
MNLAQILQTHAVTTPHATAIIDTHRGQRRTTTFAQLEQASARMAAQLHQAGLRPGDAVLIFHPMSAELYIALAAVFRSGLIATFIDPGQGRPHIERCCNLRPPQALIASPKAHLLRLVSPALRHIPGKFVVQRDGHLKSWNLGNILKFKTLNSKLKTDIHPSSSNTPALLTFTSGSTGQPKAALRTHGFLLAQYRVLAESLGLTAGQVDLSTMPIVALANLASGAISLIPKADLRYPGKIDPAPVVAQIQTEQVISTVASPALLGRVARYCLSKNVTFKGLQKVFTGGAPIFPRLLEQLQHIAPNAVVSAVYGSTEAEPIAKISYHHIIGDNLQAMSAGRGLLAGQPVEAIRLKIIKDQWGASIGPYTEAQFASVCCPAEKIGEIVVSGAHVLPGYLNGQGDEETKFRVGAAVWHRTGDAGYLDQQGQLWLVGRCAARIDDERGMLYPFTVECAVSQFADVRRSAVILHRGRRLLAIELDNNAVDLEALKNRIAWAHIDEIRILKHLPVDKRHNAKIDYPALHQLINKTK